MKSPSSYRDDPDVPSSREHPEKTKDHASGSFIPIFHRVLGDDFERLPPAILETHMTTDQSHWVGRANVTRGTRFWSRLIAGIFGFPKAASDISVKVAKTSRPNSEVWVRTFGNRHFRSRLTATDKGMSETFGPFTFLLGLRFDGSALLYPVVACRIGLLPLPGWFVPKVVAREYVEDGFFRFDVAIHAPLTESLIVRYRGWLKSDHN